MKFIATTLSFLLAATAAPTVMGGVFGGGDSGSSSKKRSSSSDSDDMMSYKGRITITNVAEEGGVFMTPVWVGIHDGQFDLYNRDEPASEELEAIAEDGAFGPLSAAFLATDGAIWDGAVIGMIDGAAGPLVPGFSNSVEFDITVERGTPLYFSYASMVLPSNDAFVANGNPMAHRVVRANGWGQDLEFYVSGGEVLDAGTEVNDESLENAPPPQTMAGNGTPENGVVTGPHPGPIDINGPLFANFPMADFTVCGYNVLKIEVHFEEYYSSGRRALRGEA